MNVCFYCDAPFAPRGSRPRTIDHVVPKAMLRKAGWLFANEWHALNRVPCCEPCNTAKGNTPPHVWCRQLANHAGKARLYDRLIALRLPTEALREAMA